MTNERTRALVALLCGAGIPLACSGGGSRQHRQHVAVGAQLSDYAASWDGYAEAYTFLPDGSDHVRLTIDANGQGTLQVGDAALLAPADRSERRLSAGSCGGQSPLWPEIARSGILNEGVLYPLHAPRFRPSRIQAGLKPNDYYAAWCALQTPVPFPLAFRDGWSRSTAAPGELLSPAAGDVRLPLHRPRMPVTQAGALGLGRRQSLCGRSDHAYSCAWTLGGDFLSTDGSIPQKLRLQRLRARASGLRKAALCLDTSALARRAVARPSRRPGGSTPAQYPVELDGALDATGTTLTGTLHLQLAPASPSC